MQIKAQPVPFKFKDSDMLHTTASQSGPGLREVKEASRRETSLRAEEEPGLVCSRDQGPRLLALQKLWEADVKGVL